MKPIRHTTEQIICKLKSAEKLIAQPNIVVNVGHVIEVTEPTDHRWRQQYRGMESAKVRCLRKPENEIIQLTKVL